MTPNGWHFYCALRLVVKVVLR
ncbi:DUF3265 domain-containing protein [Vibrio splendidus]|nr:DUF3265 domain-containing protein [Vibrio splendidus]